MVTGEGVDRAPALTRLRRQFCADSNVLMTACAGACVKLDLQGHDDDAWRAYAGHFFALDPFMLALQGGRLPLGRVVSMDAVIPTPQLAASEYYNDFWRPMGIAHEAGAFCSNGAGTCLHLALVRESRVGPYQPEELARLGVYVRHLFRALRLQAALTARRSPDLDAFARQYRLTPAELALVAALAQTGTLPAAANRLRRSHNTARAQLRAIFGKTGVRSQVALVTLLHPA